MSIKHKLALGFGLLFTLMFAILWLTLRLQLGQTLSQQTRLLGEIMAKQTADSVTELVLANDRLGLNVVLSQLAREPGVLNVTVTDVDGLVLETTASNRPGFNAELSYQAPITLQDAVAGHVTLTLDPALLRNPLARPQTVFYAVIATGLLLVLVLAWTMAAVCNRPVQQLLALIENPDTLPEQQPRADEEDLAQLQTRIYELLERRQALENQVEVTGLPDPDELAGLSLRAERRMCSLLLVEVNNSDTAIELLHPATLSTLLQEYQFYLRQAARLYRGTVTRVEGNRMLLSFDIRHCQDEHASNAIFCGQLFLLLMEKVAARHRARHNQALEFRLAVHSGDAYFSPLWKNRRNGRESGREETVIGKTVELVYSMLQHGSGGSLTASELSLDLAGGQNKFDNCEAREIETGTDKLSLMTYILSAGSGRHGELLERQCRHLIPETAPEDEQGDS